MSIKCECCNKNPNIKLSDEYIIYEGIKLFRIVATTYFKNIKRGEIGGYVQSLKNISKDAWIADNAKVFEDARITDNALAKDNAIIRGCAVVSRRSIIEGNATIKDHTKVFGWARIMGNAIISQSGQVSQNAIIGGTVEVQGLVFGETILTENDFIHENMILPSLRAA